jgi:hypothetical protein
MKRVNGRILILAPTVKGAGQEQKILFFIYNQVFK